MLSRVGHTARDSRGLVVGGGRGLLPGGLAELGFDITAVDPSSEATQLAQAAAHAGLDITHRAAPTDDFGVADGRFDFAFVADTFEITTELDRVAAQVAAALRPGGLLVYDTVNRTMVSRLIYLGLFQTLPMTRIMPPGRYASTRLRTPREVTQALDHQGLRNMDICAFKPKNPLALVKAILARRRGTITDDDLPSMVDFVLDPQGKPVVTYLGSAIKQR